MYEFLNDPIGTILVCVCVFGGLYAISLLFEKNKSWKAKLLWIGIVLVAIYLTNLYFAPIRHAHLMALNAPCSNVPSEDYEDCLQSNQYSKEYLNSLGEDNSLIVTTKVPTEQLIKPSCYSWVEAVHHINEFACIEGVVYQVYDASNAYFIDFDTSNSSFYGVSFTNKWNNSLVGSCVRLTGTISSYKGRPQMIISNFSQLGSCN